MKEARLLFLYAETPLHVGASDGLGIVDLPIQRESATGLPMVAGSSLRGAMREQYGAQLGDAELDLFGPRPPDRDLRTGSEGSKQDPASPKANGEGKNLFQGALSVVDASVLLFPVRSAVGGWAYLTAPLVLARLMRHLEAAGLEVPKDKDWRDLASTTPSGALVTSTSRVQVGTGVVFEDFELEAKPSRELDRLAEWLAENALLPTPATAPFRARLKSQLVLVPDAALVDFSQQATEVMTRVRIDQSTGTVAEGALWTEEALPSETLLWTTLFITRPRRPGSQADAGALTAKLSSATKATDRIWLGGDQGTGRGFVAARIFGG